VRAGAAIGGAARSEARAATERVLSISRGYS